MVEIAPHQYVNRKIFRLREHHGDGYQHREMAVTPAEASAKQAEAACCDMIVQPRLEERESMVAQASAEHQPKLLLANRLASKLTICGPNQ
jgi:hypothetical protein